MSSQTEDYIAEYRDLGVTDLVHQWEEPMPPEARELLLAELKTRRYRIKSLPDAPNYDPAVDLASSSATPTPKTIASRPTAQEKVRKRVSGGISMIFFLGIVQVGMGGLSGIMDWGDVSTQLKSWEALDSDSLTMLDGQLVEVAVARFQVVLGWALATAIPLVLGVFFLIVHRFAKSRPRLGLGLALLVFVMLHVLRALEDPSTLLTAGIFKAFVVISLILGWVASRELDSSPETESGD